MGLLGPPVSFCFFFFYNGRKGRKSMGNQNMCSNTSLYTVYSYFQYQGHPFRKKTFLTESSLQPDISPMSSFCWLTSFRGFLSFFSLTGLGFFAFFFFALSSSLSSPSSLLSLAEAFLSYLIDRHGGTRSYFSWLKQNRATKRKINKKSLTLLQCRHLLLRD